MRNQEVIFKYSCFLILSDFLFLLIIPYFLLKRKYWKQEEFTPLKGGIAGSKF